MTIEAQRLVDAWNQHYPIGTDVTVKRDSGEIVKTKTRSEAYITTAGYPVIFVDGIVGYYLLERVAPVPL